MNEYVILSIYFSGKFKNDIKKITAKTASREIHLINNLKTKMLVEMNTIKSERIDILFFRSTTSILSYKMNMFIKLKPKGRAVRQLVYI